MARQLHKNLLAKVVNAPNNLFFDKTTVGKLQDNFTSDVSKADTDFFHAINWVLSSLIECLLKIGFALCFSNYMIIAVVVNLYFLNKLLKYTMSGNEECVRVSSQSRRKM